MPISYGGIPLTPPANALALVEQWWHNHRIFESEYPAYFQLGIHHLPIPYPPRRESPRIGVLRWPNGASRWATCHLLATGQQLAAIQAAGSPPLVLSITDGTTTISAPMYRLMGRPVEVRGLGQDLYFVTLVDERFYWWESGNQSAPASPSTWSGLLTSLFSSLGVTPTISSVASGYSAPTVSRWAVGYEPLPLLIDAACRTVGLRCIRSLSGNVSCVNFSTAAASDLSQWTAYQYQCLAGGRIPAMEIGLYVPASCGVVFEGSGSSVATETLSGLALSQFGSSTGISGRVGQVIADTPSTATNTVIANYATQAATDYYLWHLSQTDATFRTIRNWSPTGLEECIEWSHGSDSIVTRVVAQPPHDHNIYGSQPPVTVSPGSGPLTQNAVPTADASGNLQSVPQYITDTPGANTGYTVTQYVVPNLGANTSTSPITQYTLDTSSGTPKFTIVQYTSGLTGTNGQSETQTPTAIIRQYQLDNSAAFYEGIVPQSGSNASPLQYVIGGNSTLGQGLIFYPTMSGNNVTQYQIAPALYNGSNTVQAIIQYTVSSNTITETLPSNFVADYSSAGLKAPTAATNTNTTTVATTAFVQAQIAATGGGGGWTSGTVAATGTTQAGAAPITTNTVNITGGNSSNGVLLPDTPGIYVLWNSAGAMNTVNVYPPVGSTIALLAINTPYVLNPQSAVIMTWLTSAQWSYVALAAT